MNQQPCDAFVAGRRPDSRFCRGCGFTELLHRLKQQRPAPPELMLVKDNEPEDDDAV